MGTFLYRCPKTGQHVQGWAADDAPPSDDNETYLTQRCPACMRMHLVNPKNGEVLGWKTHRSAD